MLWIVVDGMDRAGLDALAAESPEATLVQLELRGVSFEHAYAAAPWTGASLASALSATLPSTHGVRSASDRLRDDVALLPEALAANGLRTGAVVSDFRLGSARGFARGWGAYDSDPALVRGEASSPAVTRGALAFLRDASRSEERFLLLAHYSDPRPPLLVHDRARLPERAPKTLATAVDGVGAEGVGLELLQVMAADVSDAERDFLRALQREELRATDASIGLLLAALRSMGLEESTWVVVSGGHGVELFEHGWVGDGHGAWEELLHVPCIVVPPGPRRAPRSIAATVSLASLAPTIAALLDTPFDGGAFPSLEAVARGEDLPGDGCAPFEVDHEPAAGPPQVPIEHLRGVVSGGWKWIEDLRDGSTRLVRPADDPSELRDLAPREAVRARQLAARLRRVLQPATP
ncbi:MAG TPA: sulfatase-like hydrolase/transferase [Planctomycetota bacterium]|nr:sulfatase-like hydrolase/transferase [Planctomycetota bacterium]